MDFFADIIVDRKGYKEIFETYLVNINGIYFDDLSSIQLIYIIRGNIEIELNNKFKQFKSGDLIILNQFENKFIYSKGDNLLLVLNIKSGYLKNLGNEYYTSRFNTKVENVEVKDYILSEMLKLYRNSNNNKLNENINLIENIVNILLKNLLNSQNVIFNFDEKSLYMEEIEDNIYKENEINLNLGYIAKSLHISMSYLSKIFNNISGIKFTDFKQQIKLFYSTTYILNTRKNFEDISEIVNFGSIKSLNRVFNKYLNITPSKYREIYKKQNNNFKEKDIDFIKINNKYKIINYEEYFKNSCSKNMSNYEVNINEHINEKYFKSWRTIRNLNALGNNYMLTLDKLTKDFNIKEIMLRFGISKNQLILEDLNKSIDMFELNDILNKCIDNGIKPIISIQFLEYKNKINTAEIISEKKTLSIEFLNKLSRAVGFTNMRRFTYIIDISSLPTYVENKDNLKQYLELVNYQYEELCKILEWDDFEWGFELGQINFENSQLIEKCVESLNNLKFKNQPRLISLTSSKYNNKYVKDIGKIKKEVKEQIKEINNLAKSIKYDISKVYINNLFYNIDLSNINKIYRDLIMVNVMLELIYEENKEINYIAEYKIKNDLNNNYYPVYKDNTGFYTPIYWASLLLDSIEGDLVFKEPGCVVSKNLDDIYVLLYGDVESDYYYAKSKKNDTFEDDYRIIELSLNGIDGKYKIVTERLSLEYGTPEYFLKCFEDYTYLNKSEREYIKRLSVPKLEINLKDIDYKYKNRVKIRPFEMVVQKYVKI